MEEGGTLIISIKQFPSLTNQQEFARGGLLVVCRTQVEGKGYEPHVLSYCNTGYECWCVEALLFDYTLSLYEKKNVAVFVSLITSIRRHLAIVNIQSQPWSRFFTIMAFLLQATYWAQALCP